MTTPRRGALLYEGSVKRVYAVEGREDQAIFEFTDRISVFDKWIPNPVPGKGEVLARTAAFWFQQLDAIGVRHHFIGQLAPTELRVERIEVERDYAQMTPGRRSVLIPCEFVTRHYAAGSFHDRQETGALEGVPPGTYPYGARLPAPFCETSTKVERTDRLIGRDEALRISGMTPGELDDVWTTCLRIDALIESVVAARGLIHADGKKEFARDADGALMLVDVFGTPDEDRWWDAAAWARGEIVQISKEFVRQHYRGIGYTAALYAARRAGEPEPPIPPMPEALVAETGAMYRTFLERLTGEAM